MNIPHRLQALATLLFLALSVSPVYSQVATAPASAPATSGPATSAPASTAPVVDAKSAEVLHKMADFYKSIKTASAQVETKAKFEGGGQKEERATSTSFAIERPNKLAVVVKDDKLGGGSIVSDGKLARLNVVSLKRYSEEQAPATLDELLDTPVTVLAQDASIALILFLSVSRFAGNVIMC